MYIHCLLKKINDGEVTEGMSDAGMVKNIKSLVWKDKSKPFFYLIGGMTFTIEEMKHGVLRGNKK